MSAPHQDHRDRESETPGMEDAPAASGKDLPSRLLGAVVTWMPQDRREWGEAMLAELAQIQDSASRWSFAVSCFRAALFPPGKRETLPLIMFKSILPIIGAAALIGFALLQPETSGAGLARAFIIYGIGLLLIPSFTFANLLLLAGVAYVVIGHALGWRLWPKSPWLRSWARLAVEVVFGLLNPLLYLAVLANSLALRPSESEWWIQPLMAAAWILLFAFWTARACGAAFNLHSCFARAGVRALLLASLACLLAFILKDIWLLLRLDLPPEMSPAGSKILHFLRLCPLYFIPALLILDYLRSSFAVPPENAGAEKPDHLARRFFLLPDRSSRFAVALAVAGALATFALAAHRRSEASVRQLVSGHRASIQAAAAHYKVDPRLIASIVFVTHRDQLSPFREAVERLLVSAWAVDGNPMLNSALDISIGLAQIKPRTAQTASLLAAGHSPDNLAEELESQYRDAEPVGSRWPMSIVREMDVGSPIPVPSERRAVAQMLLQPEINLRTCALLLDLYQMQWEMSDPSWSIRERPDILATLYQIGFARSKPHGAPRSNAFGQRVQQVSKQPWLAELFPASL